MKQTLNTWRQLAINLRYCCSTRRATQNMSVSRMRLASRSLPTIDSEVCIFARSKVNCEVMPLHSFANFKLIMSRHRKELVARGPKNAGP